MTKEFESKKRMVAWSLDTYPPDELMVKGVSMNPEFKAYVEAVCDTVEGVQPGSVITSQSRAGIQPVTSSKKNFFTVIADFLEALPPYYCELKMVPGVKRILRQTSPHHDAIGYHGLV